jgi:hypothetical protein
LLYLLTPLVPRAGPSISDALPLDELPGHAGAPILLFALAWTAAAWATGAVAPRTRFTLTTILTFWACQIVLDTASLGIVRQVHLLSALPAALSSPAPYLAAAIVTVVSNAQRSRPSDGSDRNGHHAHRLGSPPVIAADAPPGPPLRSAADQVAGASSSASPGGPTGHMRCDSSAV